MDWSLLAPQAMHGDGIMRINDLSTPRRFALMCSGSIMRAKQTDGNVVIEADVPGAIVDFIGPGCFAFCTIAEGLLVIHRKVA